MATERSESIGGGSALRVTDMDTVECPPTGGIDSERLQLAVDLLSTDRIAQGKDPGGTVQLSAGRYRLDRPLILRSHIALEGSSLTGTVIEGAGRGAVIRVPRNAEGARVEAMHLCGHRGTASAGVVFAGGGSFLTLRRLRISDVGRDGLQIRPGRYEQLCVEDTWVSDCGRNGVTVAADVGSRGIFFTGLTVGTFGLDHRGAAGVRLAARVQMSQLTIDPVGSGQVGVDLRAGSDHSVISPYHLRILPGGRFVLGRRAVPGVVFGVGSVDQVAAD